MNGQDQYPAYRDSGVYWLGRIPSDWACQQLKYVASLSTQKTEASPASTYVGMENVNSGDGKYIATSEASPEGLSVAFQENDVLFGKLRPYLAKSWLADFGGICSSEFLVLRTSKVAPRFLNYVTLSREFVSVVDSSTYGTKMPRASWDFIGMLKLPVPERPLSETIAKFLDYETARIDALIEKQQELIVLLQEKRQAVISHAVTNGLYPDAPMRDSGVKWLGKVPAHWEVRKLKRISDKLQGRLIVQPHRFFVDDGVPIVFGYNIKNGTIDDGDVARISLTADAAHPHAKARAGDVFTVRVGEPGATAVVPETLDGCHFASIMWIHQHPRFVSEWLVHCMNSDVVRRQIAAVNYGAAQMQFNISDAANFTLPFPPLDEQTAIAAALNGASMASDAQVARAEEMMALLQERRTALISAAVTGKIDVRDWTPPSTDVTAEVA